MTELVPQNRESNLEDTLAVWLPTLSFDALSLSDKLSLADRLKKVDQYFSHENFLQMIKDDIEDGLSFEEIVSTLSTIQSVSYSSGEGRYGFFDDEEGADMTLTVVQSLQIQYTEARLRDIYSREIGVTVQQKVISTIEIKDPSN